MKNQIALPVRQAKQSRISLWLKKENRFFTFLFEEKVTNYRALLFWQLVTSFALLIGTVFAHPLAAVAVTLWFGLSVGQLKKAERYGR